MKRIIAILIACASFIQVNAQGSGGLDRLFSNAISSGSRADGYYHLSLSSTKFNESSIKSYCNSNGIYIKNFEYGTINKFGDVQEVITGLTFFPTSKTQEYIFNHMSNRKASYDALKETVAFIYWDNKYQEQTVKWSGNVTDGCASGEGVGFLYEGTRSYYFEGYFDHGFPQGEVTYKEFTFSGIPVGADFSKLKTATSNTGKASEGMRFYTENGKLGFLRNDGTVAIRPSFKTVVQDFKDGQAIVSRNDTSEIIINTSGKVIGITARQKEAFAAAAREAEIKEQKRIEEERIAQQRKEEQARMDQIAKKNSVGRKIYWREKVSYDTSNGNILSALIGLGTTEYIVEYTAIVESIIGDSAVKCTITSVEIIDPQWGSANYLKYRKYALEDAQDDIGKTRVKEMNEFNMKK